MINLKRTYLIILFFSIGFSLLGQNLKFGLVQREAIYQRLMQEEALEEKVSQYSAQVQESSYRWYQQFQNEYAELVNQYNQTSDPEIAKKLESKKLEGEMKAKEFQIKINKYSNQLSEELKERIDKAIEEVAESRKIKQLIYAVSDTGENVILYVDQETNMAYNISDDVINLIKKNSGK